MKRIDRLSLRIMTLAAKQDAEQGLPRFILHLSDGSTIELVAQLPEALVKLTKLHIMPEREVLSIDKPDQLDSLTKQLYELFELVVLNNSAFQASSWNWKDDSDLLPQEEASKEFPTPPERNHNLI